MNKGKSFFAEGKHSPQQILLFQYSLLGWSSLALFGLILVAGFFDATFLGSAGFKVGTLVFLVCAVAGLYLAHQHRAEAPKSDRAFLRIDGEGIHVSSSLVETSRDGRSDRINPDTHVALFNWRDIETFKVRGTPGGEPPFDYLIVCKDGHYSIPRMGFRNVEKELLDWLAEFTRIEITA